MRIRIPILIFTAGLLVAAALVPSRRVTPGVVADSSAHNRGAELFATTGCVHCHGPAGVGGDIGPDLQEVRKRMKKDAIARQIHDGDKVMPAYGDQLDKRQIDDLVAYLDKKRKVIIVPAATPVKTMSDPDNQ